MLDGECIVWKMAMAEKRAWVSSMLLKVRLPVILEQGVFVRDVDVGLDRSCSLFDASLAEKSYRRDDVLTIAMIYWTGTVCREKQGVGSSVAPEKEETGSVDVGKASA